MVVIHISSATFSEKVTLYVLPHSATFLKSDPMSDLHRVTY